MDETPKIFEMLLERSLLLTSKKSVTVQTSGSEKKHETIVLTVAADGFMLLPMNYLYRKN